MVSRRRVDLRGILADSDLRRALMVPTLQATQAREGIATTREQAERAYLVVTETERAAFFNLERFRGGKGEPDRRHEMFVWGLSDGLERVRWDVAHRAFSVVEGNPLSFDKITLISPLFTASVALQPEIGRACTGLSTGGEGSDERFLRMRWEPSEAPIESGGTWRPYAKGGEFSRFYGDLSLVVMWRDNGLAIKTNPGSAVRCEEYYGREGVTWTQRSQRGISFRYLPARSIFAAKGPSIFPVGRISPWFLLSILNSRLIEFVVNAITSFGSYQVGAIQALPIATPRAEVNERLEGLASTIHDAKARWDEGNEISTRFRVPQILREDLIGASMTMAARLDCLARHESAEDARIQKLYAQLNDEVYNLYNIPDSMRTIIEETLDERPPEVLWPQMEGRSLEQKRMEHVLRLLSYVVKRVVEADEDGIVPIMPVAGEASLADRVHRELEALFPTHDIGHVEAEIANELRASVKGYRRTRGIAEWLENAFFQFHCSLYKNRPIIWHIASSQGASSCAFGALVHYHRFDKNRMAQLRGQYLRGAMDTFRREAALADKNRRTDARQDWQARLEEAQDLDRRLQHVQEGYHDGPDGGDTDYRILTPWKAPENRPTGWDPDFDDGVKVNIGPMQKAGVLRVAKVV